MLSFDIDDVKRIRFKHTDTVHPFGGFRITGDIDNLSAETVTELQEEIKETYVPYLNETLFKDELRHVIPLKEYSLEEGVVVNALYSDGYRANSDTLSVNRDYYPQVITEVVEDDTFSFENEYIVYTKGLLYGDTYKYRLRYPDHTSSFLHCNGKRLEEADDDIVIATDDKGYKIYSIVPDTVIADVFDCSEKLLPLSL